MRQQAAGIKGAVGGAARSSPGEANVVFVLERKHGIEDEADLRATQIARKQGYGKGMETDGFGTGSAWKGGYASALAKLGTGAGCLGKRGAAT